MTSKRQFGVKSINELTTAIHQTCQLFILSSSKSEEQETPTHLSDTSI